LSNNEFNASLFLRQSPNNVALQRARSLLEIQKQEVCRFYPPTPTQVSLTPGKLIQVNYEKITTTFAQDTWS
jgi:hypothetical protein